MSLWNEAQVEGLDAEMRSIISRNVTAKSRKKQKVEEQKAEAWMMPRSQNASPYTPPDDPDAQSSEEKNRIRMKKEDHDED